ncbi:hypothetical protein MJD09_02840, partial [bacterium]|nr:hypothetical protein [bacterium]
MSNKPMMMIVLGLCQFFGFAVAAEKSHKDKQKEFKDLVRRQGRRFDQSMAFGDISGDGFEDLIIGAPGAVPSGKVYVIYGRSDLNAKMGEIVIDPESYEGAKTVISGILQDESFGQSVASGDLNNDGMDDIIIGAPRDVRSSADTTLTYLIYGNSTLPNEVLDLRTEASSTFTKLVTRGIQRVGWSLASGDVDSNGFDDVIVGAPFADADNGPGSGIVFVLYPQRDLSRLDTGEIDLRNGVLGDYHITQIIGEAVDDRAGWAVTAGQVDGRDGDEVIFSKLDLKSNGRVYVCGESFFFPSNIATNVRQASNAQHILKGENGSKFGLALSVRSIDEDSDRQDIIVGAPSAEGSGGESGETYIFTRMNLKSTPDSVLVTDATLTINGSNPRDKFGWSVAAGDIDNDGLEDLIVGAPQADGANGLDNAGAAYVFWDTTLGLPATVDANSASVVVGGKNEGEFLGYSVTAGNLNGGGKNGEDLVLDAPGADRTEIIFGRQLTADFLPVAGSQFCSGQMIDFVDQSDSIRPIKEWLWDFNGESTSTEPNPSILFTTPGFKTIKLKITDSLGFMSQVGRQITILERPVCAVNITSHNPGDVICGDDVNITGVIGIDGGVPPLSITCDVNGRPAIVTPTAGDATFAVTLPLQIGQIDTIVATCTLVDSCGSATVCKDIIEIRSPQLPVCDINITSPVDSSIVCSEAVMVTGTLSVEGGTRPFAIACDVDGVKSVVDTNGNFTATVPLKLVRDNTLVATATVVDSCGAQTICSDTTAVFHPPDPICTVSIITPEDSLVACGGPITAMGMITVSDGIGPFSIICDVNGVSADVDSTGAFIASVPLDFITGDSLVATCTVTDSCGNEVVCTDTAEVSLPAPLICNVEIISPEDSSLVCDDSVMVAIRVR